MSHVRPRETLLALDVPWMISPSVPGLHCKSWENGDTHVSVNISILAGVDPRHKSCGAVSRVVMQFARGQWVKMSPAAGDGSAFPVELYDQSKLPMTDVEIDDYSTRFNALWSSSQRCPDPGIYEIHNSRWLLETGAAKFGCKHYVIDGHDAYAEVLAPSVKWSYVSNEDPRANNSDRL